MFDDKIKEMNCEHSWCEAPYLICDKIPKIPRICKFCYKIDMKLIDPKCIDYTQYEESILFIDGVSILYKKINND